jgi:predicted XRE-type DNA-binding protein
MNDEVIVEESCGNVFADLGLPNADELYAKALLSIAIERTIEGRGLTVGEAAKLIRVPEAELIDLTDAEFSGFTINQLLAILDAPGWRGQQM